MNKKTIAVKVAMSPIARKLVLKALKNRRVQKILIHQAQRQLKRRLDYL